MFWLRGGRPGPRLAAFLDSLGYTFFNFSVVMAIGLLCVIGFASRPLRIWPSPWSAWIGPGLVLFSLWSLLRAFVPTLAPEGLYHLTSLVLALGLLSAFFTESAGTGQRTFAVLLAAALMCSAWTAISEGLRRLGALPLEVPSGRAGELLALAAGAVAPGLIPHRHHERSIKHAFPHATLAAIPAALFFLVYARRAGDPFGAPRWSLGWTRDLPLPEGFDGLLYAGVMFLFLFALIRALSDPAWRVRGFGLAFLFLAGIQYRIAYQHLLGLIGLVLLTRGGLAAPPDAAAPGADAPQPHPEIDSDSAASL